MTIDPVLLTCPEQSIAEQVDAILTIKGEQLRIKALSAYWYIGQALCSHPAGERVADVIRYMSHKVSASTLYRCAQFYRYIPELENSHTCENLEDALSAEFPGYSWHKICAEVLPDGKEVVEEKTLTASDRRWQAIQQAEKLARERIGEIWEVQHQTELEAILDKIKA